ncbi:hypothetical protein BGW38_001197 [Lunasporangiospora selenospora]|uniref:Uncharacterized protein n=1 Tax=Lunasporangiospora selenospora TaxID=979761 RepID=A0A9P6FU26_9FUNG|nr:hypothetical protein BGW38_001197 [Lunasporangiospora selenospora]
MKAMYLRMKGEEAEMPCTGVEKKVRIMLETLLEYLPLKTYYTVSESTFTVKCAAPIIQAYVNNEKVVSDFPNTDSTTQKNQSVKADRPDIRATALGQELLWGEVTRPAQARNIAKVCWDTYKLARFGKSFILAGNESAPLVQIVGSLGTYMKLYLKIRGVMILEEVDTFIVLTCKAMVPSLVATLPTLELLKDHVKEVSSKMDGKASGLKRSWGHKDIKDIKKRLR